MKFRPLHDRVVVKRLDSEEKTAGGIIIPDTAKEKPSEGEVVAVGDGAHGDDGKLIAMAVKAGDKVLFGKWSGPEESSESRGPQRSSRQRGSTRRWTASLPPESSP